MSRKIIVIYDKKYFYFAKVFMNFIRLDNSFHPPVGVSPPLLHCRMVSAWAMPVSRAPCTVEAWRRLVCSPASRRRGSWGRGSGASSAAQSPTVWPVSARG